MELESIGFEPILKSINKTPELYHDKGLTMFADDVDEDVIEEYANDDNEEELHKVIVNIVKIRVMILNVSEFMIL